MSLETKWLDSPVFILSIGKSGTTLLISLFDGHDQLLVIPEETDYFSAIHDRVVHILNSFIFTKKRKVKEIIKLYIESTHLKLFNGIKREKSFATDNVDYSDFNFSLFKELMFDKLYNSELSIANIIKAVPYAFQKCVKPDAKNIISWIEKTPYHKYNVENKTDILSKEFPLAKFIHIFRDPVDNFIAFNKKHGASWTANRFIYDFKRNVSITKKYANQPNHMIITYESIILDTDAALMRLTNFLNIEFKDILKVPTKNGMPWQGNSVESSRFKGISTSSLNKHLKFEDKEKLHYIEFYLKDEMEYLGYKIKYNKGIDQSISTYETYAKDRMIDDEKDKKNHTLLTKFNTYKSIFK